MIYLFCSRLVLGKLIIYNNVKKDIIAKSNDVFTYSKGCPRTQNNLAPYEEHIRGLSKIKGFCFGKGIGKRNSLDNGIVKK